MCSVRDVPRSRVSHGEDTGRWCPGRCNAGARRLLREHDQALAVYAAALEEWQATGEGPEPERPAPPRLYPSYGDPVWCPSCTWDIKARLSHLDGAACVYLREADGLRGQSDQPHVSGTRGGHSPSPAVEDLDEFDGWLRDWKAAYLGADTMARQGALADSITLGCAWLVAHAEQLLARPDLAVDFGTEVHAWHRRLARWDPSDIVVKRMRVRCPSCRGLTLEWRQGEDKVRCRRRDCGRVLTLAEHEALEETEGAGAAADRHP